MGYPTGARVKCGELVSTKFNNRGKLGQHL